MELIADQFDGNVAIMRADNVVVAAPVEDLDVMLADAFSHPGIVEMVQVYGAIAAIEIDC